MAVAAEVTTGMREIGIALRRPEEFAKRWRDRDSREAPKPVVFPILVANAIVGLAAYGLVVGMQFGALEMLRQAIALPIACGIAWLLALPALYIINSSLGSRLDGSTTTLAALVTVSFGALAMLASVPVTWFFSIALPDDMPFLQILVQLVIFAGVGFCMADVFLRVMGALEPHRDRVYAFVWLCLVATIGLELMSLLDVGPFTSFNR